jgi:hypothetical protein
MAVVQKDAATARECYIALLPQQRTFIEDATISIDRVLGLLSRTMGDLERAVSHFEEALGICRKSGFLVETARLCFDYAATLLHATPDNSRKAQDVVD